MNYLVFDFYFIDFKTVLVSYPMIIAAKNFKAWGGIDRGSKILALSSPENVILTKHTRLATNHNTFPFFEW